MKRRILDPRRTNVLSSVEKEEMVIPYEPSILIDPKEVSTHYNHVIGVQEIKSSPTDLESTSIVLAYGLDIFSTRRTPSKPFDTLSDDFSYAQLLASILVLIGGIAVSRYFVSNIN